MDHRLINTFLLLFLSLFFAGSGCEKKTDPDPLPDPPGTGDYKLVWSDEFDYSGLPDNKKWDYDTLGNGWGWGNNEAQYYTSFRLANATVNNGALTITARKEDYEGFNYTSARLITKNKGDWLYGRMEIRAILPEGRGMWPAIWMLPTDWVYGSWPSSGEIDIMENVGYEPYVIVGSAHTELYNHIIGTQKSSTIYVANCYSDYNIYAMEWEQDEYRLFVNDSLYFTFKNEGAGYQSWPFNQRFHLLLNVAVGGDWGGAQGIDDSIFPQSMIIDWVRVYQRE